ncbi:MAG: hypothetical protein ISS17_01235 [Bacteroidales bacterium]|nr:hypothetical protein [Bacteroidales bacterium]
MLIRYFRSSFPGQFVTIGVIGLLLWGAGGIHPPLMPPPDGPVPLYSLLYDWLSGFPYIAMAVGFLLVIFQAIWFNYIVSRRDLVPHNTSLAALLFLLFISLIPSYLTLTPVNITTFFLLFILRALLEAYNQSEPVELVYTAGFFVALSSFFYLPSLLFYGFLLIFFLIYRSLKWREWVSSLIGLATPFLYLVVLYFLTDRISGLPALYTDFFGQVILTIPEVGWREWILFSLLGLFTILGLQDTLRHIGEKTVELRKKNVVLLWMLFWSLLTIFYAHALHLYHLGLLSICLAVFVTNFYMHLRRPFWFELLLWLLLLALYVNTALGHFFFAN